MDFSKAWPTRHHARCPSTLQDAVKEEFLDQLYWETQPQPSSLPWAGMWSQKAKTFWIWLQFPNRNTSIELTIYWTQKQNLSDTAETLLLRISVASDSQRSTKELEKISNGDNITLCPSTWILNKPSYAGVQAPRWAVCELGVLGLLQWGPHLTW